MHDSSGGVEALVRTLASHAQDVPDRLPRQANIACAHHGLIERAFGGTEAYLRNRNSCEGRIIDCGHRIRTIPVVGVLDLVKHLFGGLHILLPPQELLARRHSMKDEAVIIDTDLDQVTDREGPTMMTYPSK
jgi:hypothetical protein